MRPSLNRRGFLAASLGFAGLAAAGRASAELYASEITGYGPLIRSEGGVLDLPEGFACRVISRAGDRMSDGLVVPERADGMGCFPAGEGRVVLMRNHENSADRPESGPFGRGGETAGASDLERIYDRSKAGEVMPGGVTRLTYDLGTGRVVDEHLALAGTLVNCAGGTTPRRTWLSCEEVVDTPTARRSHGWVFEAGADDKGLAHARPLTAMGRFKHEATCTDRARASST